MARGKYPLEFKKSDDNGGWRWHVQGPNGEIVFQCAEGDGFSSKAEARANFKLACRIVLEYRIVEVK